MPISRARSTDATSSRSLIVSSSMSRRLTWMSPAMTMPLSSTRSRMSARLADPLAAGRAPWRGARRSISVLLGLVAGVAAQPPVLAQLAAVVDGDLVAGQHVGRLGYAAQLEHLERHLPAVLAAAQAEHALDRAAGQHLHLLGGAARDVH